MVVVDSKAELRTYYKKIRSSIAGDQKSSLEFYISQRISALLEDLNIYKLIASYNSFKNEADVNGLKTSADIAYPRMTEDGLYFYKINADDELTEHSWGLKEPQAIADNQVSNEDIQLVLVPGVSFDQRGARLGYGKGHYDRFLQNFLGIKVGVCFSDQMANDFLPTQEHDQFMDYIITNDFTLKIME